LRDVDVDFAAGLEVGDFEFWGFVVTFGAPGDVVGVAEGVDVEDVDVGGGEKEVLEELWGDLGGVDKLGDCKGLTEVKRCQGSKNRNDMTNHITYVDAKETIRVKKSGLWMRSAIVNFLSLVSIWIERTVMKTEAKTR